MAGQNGNADLHGFGQTLFNGFGHFRSRRAGEGTCDGPDDRFGEFRLVAQVDAGKVLAQVPKESERLTARMALPAMKNVTVTIRAFDDPVAADVKELDLVTFYFAYHDTTFLEVDRAKMNKALFAALKPGGILVVADHAARPEDGATVGKTLHRIAEASLRAEIEAAGFKFVAGADFLRHPEDTRTNIVFKNPTPVDEFVLKFQKPN